MSNYKSLSELEKRENESDELYYRRKMLEIRKLTSIAKDMTVDMGKSGGYKARSIKAVLDSVIPMLNMCKIDVVCTNITCIHAGETHFKGIYTYRFIDVETGFYEDVMTVGGGADRSDKDTGKATTYAFKYLFTTRFSADSGEDTDNTSSAITIDDSLNNLKNIMISMWKEDYFLSDTINPSKDIKQAEIQYQALGQEIAKHKNNGPWLLRKENELTELLSQLRMNKKN